MSLKPFLLALAVILFTRTPASAITADELQRYLGVNSWTTVVALPPESFIAEIYEIKDGAPAGRIIEGDSRWTKKADSPLTIMAGTQDGKYRIVVAYQGGVTTSAHTSVKTYSVTVSPNLPTRIEEGDYVLFGHPASPSSNKTPEDISSYSSGFLLRVKSYRQP